jgi:C_GCAxxG_C_C family probable redox protein
VGFDCDRPQQAVQFFQEGFNCAQAVVCAFAPLYAVSAEQAFRSASGFGGGIGNSGETCGVLTGAVMVIGLHFSADTPGDSGNKERVYALVQELTKRFVAARGSTLCRILKEPAKGDPVARRKLCAHYVEEAASILQSMLAET